jgi:hypothetical protein
LYEELRRHMLEGSAAVGNHFGLVLLLRDGMTAWMRGVAAPSTAARPVASSQPSRLPLSDEINASIVAVLANIVERQLHFPGGDNYISPSHRSRCTTGRP